MDQKVRTSLLRRMSMVLLGFVLAVPMFVWPAGQQKARAEPVTLGNEWSSVYQAPPVQEESRIQFHDIAYHDGVWIAISRDTSVMRSTDGINWSPVPNSQFGIAPEDSPSFSDILFADGKWVIGRAFGGIYTSTDGQEWAVRKSPTDADRIGAIVYANDKFTALSYKYLSGQPYSYFLTSADGTNWTQTGGTSNITYSGTAKIEFGAGKYVLTTVSGGLYTSTDGIQWNLNSSVQGLYPSSIAYDGSEFWMAARIQGSNPTSTAVLYQSTNGENWTPYVIDNLVSSDTVTLRGIDFSSGRYTAVGSTSSNGSNQLIAYSSVNGTEWTRDVVNGGTSTNGGYVSLDAAASSPEKSAAVGTSMEAGIIFARGLSVSKDSDLQNLEINPGTLQQPFDPNVTSYYATVTSDVYRLNVTPTAVNPEAQLKISVNDRPAGEASSQIPFEASLREGSNVIEIQVSAPSTNPNPKTYTLYVFREPSAYLQNLEVDAGELRPVFKRDVNEYNVYVTPDTNKIEIRPTAESERAVITVNGQQTVSGSVYTAQLQEGPNDIRIVVTNDSLPPARMKSGEANVLAVQNQQVYTVVVHRAAREPNARLANLAIDPGTLAPAFDPERTDYTATVTNDVYNLEVAASAIDPEAVVTVRGSAIEEGSARIVPLTVGANEIDVVVNAGGETTRTYKITVTRQAAAVDPGPGPVIPIPDFTPTPTPTPTTPAPTTPTTPADGLEVIVNGQPTTIVATGGTSQSNGQTVFTATIDTARLAAQLTSGGANQSVIIPVRTQADRVIATLTGEAVNLLGSNQATLRLETPLGNYTLPSSQLRLSAAAGTLGTPADSADLDVNITIQASGADVQNALSQAAASEGFTSVSTPLDFMITASNGERNVEVNNFTQYVEREIPIPAGIDPNRITTGVVIEPNGTVRHVPTAVTQTGGTYYAEVNSLTNSSYVLIWNPEQFADVAGKWSQSAVNDMASRLVVNGVGEDRFNPEGAVTRAEFAAILVRALGLPGTLQTAGFSDVASGQWYAEAAATADQYGLIAGYPDGTFRPNATITRQEAFTVLNRAAQIAPLRLPGTGSELGSYRDRADVADWATDAAESLLAAGLVEGSGGWLRPEATLSRAESAAVAQRLLRQASLIDQ